MSPYDSDSGSDDAGTQLGYTETNVLLGYADDQDGDGDPDHGETVSRLGGQPDWLGEGGTDNAPSVELAQCRVCQALMVLLLQLNGELPDRFPGHERRLYVFACRNKACRRRQGSVRVVRGVRVDAAAVVAAETEAEAKAKTKLKTKPEEAKTSAGMALGLGETLFGVANPFAAGGDSAHISANPFAAPGTAPLMAAALGSKATATKAPTPLATEDLPRTFAKTLSLAKDTTQTEKRPAPRKEAWPAPETWPKAYPVSWIVDAAYETLDPTPAPAPVPAGVGSMDVDQGVGGGGTEDKYVYESSMDAAFQAFADRVAQNPEQVLRYEFGGQPLLYSKDDEVAAQWTGQGGNTVPVCANCRGRRVFEAQLMPHAIDRLEATELGLDGMDWGTVVVAVCERDCEAGTTAAAAAAGSASYLEEWVGVQWES